MYVYLCLFGLLQEKGVKIFVLLYKEMSIAVNLLSTYSKHTLMNLCPENIKVRKYLCPKNIKVRKYLCPENISRRENELGVHVG